jgi:hypothetical protein
MFPGDARKLVQEVVERMARLEVVDERLDRHSGAREDRRSSDNVRASFPASTSRPAYGDPAGSFSTTFTFHREHIVVMSRRTAVAVEVVTETRVVSWRRREKALKHSRRPRRPTHGARDAVSPSAACTCARSSVARPRLPPRLR